MMPAVPQPPDPEASAVSEGWSDAHAAIADGSSAGLRLRPPRSQVDRRSILLWSVHAALTAIAVVALLGLAAALIEPARPWLLAATGVAAIGGIGYVVAMPRVRYRVHRWEVTDEAVYTKAGWLTHEWRVAPLSRVQTVDARRGPLQQAFGLSSVRITTASAAGDVVIDGLDHELAADLVQTLTERTQATPDDAT
jgi:membrane protein YdbS with pleckstrin-like domain